MQISEIQKYWRMVDRKLLISFFVLILMGIIIVAAAAPMVASKIGLDKFYFVKRHLFYVFPSIFLILLLSYLKPKDITYICFLVFVLSVIAVICTYFSHYEIKGARRWVYLLGVSLQPSEFLKPSFAVVSAFLFSQRHTQENFFYNEISIVLMGCVGALLFFQPDFGMLSVTFSVWFTQFFFSGLSIFFVLFASVSFVVLLITAYIFLPHVTARIDKFLDKTSGDHYQIDKSLEAFSNGGWFGMGPGEGIVKKHLPDAHADFAFAVVGEEFGFVVCLLVVCLFAFIIIRVCILATKENNLFNMLAVCGVVLQFAAQTIINISSSLHLIPTKGMTLPFISYGGSSMIASSFALGIILCFVKKDVIYGNVE